MKNLNQIKNDIDRIKFQSQELNQNLLTFKESNISTQFYLGNLKRLSLQALDLFNAMEKQISVLSNSNRFDLREKKWSILG